MFRKNYIPIYFFIISQFAVVPFIVYLVSINPDISEVNLNFAISTLALFILIPSILSYRIWTDNAIDNLHLIYGKDAKNIINKGMFKFFWIGTLLSLQNIAVKSSLKFANLFLLVVVILGLYTSVSYKYFSMGIFIDSVILLINLIFFVGVLVMINKKQSAMYNNLKADQALAIKVSQNSLN